MTTEQMTKFINGEWRHSFRCRGYCGQSQPFQNEKCDCGATFKNLMDRIESLMDRVERLEKEKQDCNGPVV